MASKVDEAAEPPTDRKMVLDESTSISLREITFVTSRSGGPGGQNVNKVETKVTAQLDLAGSASLSDEVRQKILERLANRVNSEGVLQVTCQRFRTQGANRAGAIERLGSLLRSALEEQAPRRPTRPSRGAVERRLGDKRQQADRKRTRTTARRPGDD